MNYNSNSMSSFSHTWDLESHNRCSYLLFMPLTVKAHGSSWCAAFFFSVDTDYKCVLENVWFMIINIFKILKRKKKENPGVLHPSDMPFRYENKVKASTLKNNFLSRKL